MPPYNITLGISLELRETYELTILRKQLETNQINQINQIYPANYYSSTLTGISSIDLLILLWVSVQKVQKKLTIE